MSCREFEADIVELARATEPDARATRCLAEHVEGCPECAARLELERNLTTHLRAVAAAAPTSPRAEMIAQDLLRAFAERHADVVRPVPGFAWKRVSSSPAARRWLAVAAVLVFTTGAWLGSERWWPSGDDQRGATLPSSLPPATSPPATSERIDAHTGTGSAAIHRETAMEDPPTRASRGGDARLGRSPDEGVLRFVTLPMAVDLPLFESGRVVRVELATSMLAVYGFGVDPDVASGVVEADVLVGQDNQPRAIRFVSLDSSSRRRQ